MFRDLLVLGVLAIFASFGIAKDHKLGDSKDFPKTVAVGDKIHFERPVAGGLNEITVTVDGKPVEGKFIEEKVDGKTVIGGGKTGFEIEVKEKGKIVVVITTTPKGGKATTEKHTIEAR